MGFDNFLGDGKAQPDAGRAISLRYSKELFEDAMHKLRWDSGSCVANKERYASIFTLGSDRDGSARRRKFDRIGNQVAQRMDDERCIRLYLGQIPGKRDLKP